MNNRKRNIYHLLKIIKPRPKVYLTSKSITALLNFITGYWICGMADNENLIHSKDDPSFSEFTHWLENQLNSEIEPYKEYKNYVISLEDKISLSKRLLMACNNNEEEAYELYFIKLEEFMSKIKEWKRDVLTSSDILYNEDSEKKHRAVAGYLFEKWLIYLKKEPLDAEELFFYVTNHEDTSWNKVALELKGLINKCNTEDRLLVNAFIEKHKLNL